MRSTMSISNVEYATLKKQGGSPHWGVRYQRNRPDFEPDDPEGLPDDPHNEGCEAEVFWEQRPTPPGG